MGMTELAEQKYARERAEGAVQRTGGGEGISATAATADCHSMPKGRGNDLVLSSMRELPSVVDSAMGTQQSSNLDGTLALAPHAFGILSLIHLTTFRFGRKRLAL